MTKTFTLFITLFVIATQCADDQKLIAKEAKQKSNAFIFNKSEKVERIFKALDRGDEKEFQRLITKYPSLINARRKKSGCTPLLVLVRFGKYRQQTFIENNIRFALEKGADVEAMDLDQAWKPLGIVAANAQHSAALNVVKLLIEHKADVNAHPPENKKFRPLWLAAQTSGNNTDMVQLLLENGADKTHTDKQGRTVAENTRKSGHMAIAVFIENYQKPGLGIKKAKQEE